ncbi:HEPN domain-containing protein [Acinetobacter venetianus]|uniref:HEPN domain-containing protein n=1 Tax=Acinetobacter venetianus TaxID=52133 RepID=UPI002AC055BC|nr:hypothetical protein [Acinetobacter venetianus]
MVNSNPIKLTENQTISVKVKSSKGDFFNTDISLEYGRPPSIQLMLEGEKELKAHPYRDDHRGDYYMTDFYDHSFINHAVFKYLFFGKANKDQIKKVYFTVPELSSYFQQELNFNLDNEVNISGKLKIEPLEAWIESLRLSVKIHQGYILKHNDDHTGFSFQNIIYFSFESDTALSFHDIENLMYKSISLLTWVTGYPISPDSIEVSDGNNNAYLYLPLVKKIKKYDVSFPKSFMHLKFFREYFQTICSNYFGKKEIFEGIWSRTLPLFDFTGVVEYEVMLHASILDKYFSHQVPKFHKVTSPNYSKYISKIDKFFKDNDDFKKILSGTDLIDKIKAKSLFPNKKRLTFAEKQEIYFKHIGEESLKIFISNDDFKHIKDIRDNAAHGEPEDLDTDTVYKYLWKVKILTMYLIYLDLGIKKDDFFKMISITFHPIAMNCELDKYLLDIATGKTILIELEQGEKEKFLNLNTKVNIFYKKENSYFFNSELSEMASDYFSEDVITPIDPSRIYNHEKYVQSLLNQREIDLETQYYQVIYLQENNSKVMINNVIIIF